MKTEFISLAAAVIVMSSCSTAYKNTQTPDDVYYSPAPAQKTYAQTESQDDYYSDDNYLRMKVQNRNRWACIDDYDYWYDSRYLYYNYSYSPFAINNCWSCTSPFYNPWSVYYNPFYSPWNAWNQPYCTVVYYKNPQAYYFGSTSSSNLSAYNNRKYSLYNIPLQKGSQNIYNNTNRTSVVNTNGTNSSKPVRLFNGNSSSNSGGRSGGFKTSGTGGNTRPPKPPM